ncbi:MAG: hypothetical protein GVY22_10935 [Gammaproteobacteria bacterium]|jgi:alkaline phosphatase|nr:hypothetical protein [Gammaproteobacteria bacterium]
MFAGCRCPAKVPTDANPIAEPLMHAGFPQPDRSGSFTDKGFWLSEQLDNRRGFFLMVEGDKIHWAAHANDARAAIEDTIAFDNVIKVALGFAEEHPRETLIVVTGDHECGDMTLGFAGAAYHTYFEVLGGQKLAYDDFDRTVFEPYQESR